MNMSLMGTNGRTFTRLYSSAKISIHQITQQKFRETMGRISNQAMILTTAVPIHCNRDKFRGATLSSVTSLSLMPIPLVQFNLQLPSFTSDFLHDFNHFALHLMKPNEDSIHLARNFSKGAIKHAENGEVVPTQPFEGLQEGVEYDIYEINGTNLRIPLLKNAERVIVCRGLKTFNVGDHEIWVGEVEDIVNRSVEQESGDQISGGLLYFNRNFHTLGDPIAKKSN
ncbi:unnamed protein product [Kluyveromyces dobzhanskii CBS 2104]|uniref:WGS project CCBQ000000000 data, contig 00102 n=1 Tax=Kluyveromyces dobzhanskii CBS 2104 TaxID=1427455 RepID=A0A0A8L4E8_9SACH|nr:unnamed protein product [Kluyveromyces dobzhanskii CBS 2104]